MSAVPERLLRRTARGSTKPARVEIGQRFGKLVVEGECGRRLTRKLWRCRCDCGRHAIRTSFALNAAVRDGFSPRCRECRAEYRSASWSRRRSFYVDGWRRIWAQVGSLWPHDSSELKLVAGVKEDLEAAGFRLRLERSDVRPADGEPEHEEPPPDRHQRMADIYPLRAAGGSAWECVHCHKSIEEGFGCVECLEMACVDCVRKELHKHGEEGESLASIGRLEGLSNERIRQIRDGALRKLRRASLPTCDVDGILRRLTTRPVRPTQGEAEWMACRDVELGTDIERAAEEHGVGLLRLAELLKQARWAR